MTEGYIIVDGMFFMPKHLPKRDDPVIQPRHPSDHVTMVMMGSVWAVREGELGRKYDAPAVIHIPAGVSHSFIALRDDTLLYCIHNLHGEQMVKVLDEHGLAEDAA